MRKILFWHLARIAGIVLFLGALPYCVIAWVHRAPILILFISIFVAGMVLAFFADDKLAASIEELHQEQTEIGANWNGDELVVGMRWRWLVFAVVFSSLFGFAGMLLVRGLMRGNKEFGTAGFLEFGIVEFLGFAGIIFSIISVVSLVRFAWRAYSAGYVLKLNSDGLRHCEGFDVAWQNVDGVDVVEITSIAGRSVPYRASYYLVLALNAEGAEALRAMRYRFYRVSTRLPRRADDRLRVFYNYINVSPFTLRGVVTYFAERNNVTFDPDWIPLKEPGGGQSRKDLEKWKQKLNRSKNRLFR